MQEEGVLVCAVRVGNQSALAAIVDRYQARIARYLRRLVGDRLLAEDLTQETFLSAYTAIAKNSADLALSAWLYRIATNHAKMHFRRKRLFRFLPFLESRHGGAAPPADEHLGEQDQVRRAMAQLPPHYAICLVLHIVEGFEHHEVGAIVGISTEAARKRDVSRRVVDAPMAIGDVKRWSVPGLSQTVVLSPDGANLLAAGPAGGIMEIDVATGKVRRRIPGPVYTHLALTGDGRFVVTATEGAVALLTVPRLATQAELTLPSGEQVRGLLAR